MTFLHHHRFLSLLQYKASQRIQVLRTSLVIFYTYFIVCVCVGCPCTIALCVEDVHPLPCVGSKDHTQVIRLGSKLFFCPPSRLASPEGDIFNNCLIRLENVSFCFHKNQVVKPDIFNLFLAINLDQMSVEPAAVPQLTPRTMGHSASSFRIPATNKQQQQQQGHKLF